MLLSPQVSPPTPPIPRDKVSSLGAQRTQQQSHHSLGSHYNLKEEKSNCHSTWKAGRVERSRKRWSGQRFGCVCGKVCGYKEERLRGLIEERRGMGIKRRWRANLAKVHLVFATPRGNIPLMHTAPHILARAVWVYVRSGPLHPVSSPHAILRIVWGFPIISRWTYSLHDKLHVPRRVSCT